MLYVFVVLTLRRRRLVHIGVTEHPTAVWSAQRLVEAVADSDEVPRFLVHDRDSIFGAAFRKRVRGLGVRALITPPRSPQANAFCERVIGTIRRGCTDHVLFRDEHHAERSSESTRATTTAVPIVVSTCRHPMLPDTLPRSDHRPGPELTRPDPGRPSSPIWLLGKPAGADEANRAGSLTRTDFVRRSAE